jgi:hypothetical protein
MSENIDQASSAKKTILTVLGIVIASALLLALTDGFSSLWSLSTLGLMTGPLTFLWWPYFRNEIGLQPLFGVVPVLLIVIGIRFRLKKGLKVLAYLGGVLWVLTGFLYVAAHID